MKTFFAAAVLCLASVDASKIRGLYIPSEALPESAKHKLASEKFSRTVSSALQSGVQGKILQNDGGVNGVPSGYDWSGSQPLNSESENLDKVVIKTFHTAFIHVVGGEEQGNPELQGKILQNDMNNNVEGVPSGYDWSGSQPLNSDLNGKILQGSGLEGKIQGQANENIEGVPSGYDWSGSQPLHNSEGNVGKVIIAGGAGGGIIHGGGSVSGVEGVPSGYDWSGSQPLNSNYEQLEGKILQNDGGVEGVPSGYDWSGSQPLHNSEGNLGKIVIAGGAGGGIIHGGGSVSEVNGVPSGYDWSGSQPLNSEVEGVPSGYDWSGSQPLHNSEGNLGKIVIAGGAGGGIIHGGGSVSGVNGVPSGYDWSGSQPLNSESESLSKVVIKTFHTAFIHVVGGEEQGNSELQGKILQNDMNNNLEGVPSGYDWSGSQPLNANLEGKILQGSNNLEGKLLG